MALVKRLIIVMLLLVFGLLIGSELFLRFVFPQPEHTPLRVYLDNEIEGAKPQVDYVLNEYSLRPLNWDSEGKKPGAKRILVLGGTSTDAIIHDAADTWWGQTWARVQAATPFEVEIAAYTVGGDLIMSSAKWCDDHIDELDVDLIVAEFGFGDVINGGPDYRYDPDKFEKMESDSRPEWKKTATQYSHLYRFLKAWRDKKRNKELQRQMGRKNYLAETLARRRAAFEQLPIVHGLKREANNDPLLEYLDGIDKIIEIGKSRNIPVLILGEPILHHVLLGPDETLLLKTPVRVGGAAGEGARSVPSLARPDPGWVDREAERYFETAALRCRDRGVAFYSFNGKVAKLRRNFLDDVMLTLEGGSLMADRAAPMVTALLTGRPVPVPGATASP